VRGMTGNHAVRVGCKASLWAHKARVWDRGCPIPVAPTPPHDVNEPRKARRTRKVFFSYGTALFVGGQVVMQAMPSKALAEKVEKRMSMGLPGWISGRKAAAMKSSFLARLMSQSLSDSLPFFFLGLAAGS
jgi:hypothetical protein